MDPDVRRIPEHMREFGLSLLGRSANNPTFSEMGRPYQHTLAVAEAAHGAEIVLKARIAQEHPLLIFDAVPGPQDPPAPLSVSDLLERGRTIAYTDLPAALWRATGMVLPEFDKYISFGRLRNTIQHLAVPNEELPRRVFDYLFAVIDPLVSQFWRESILNYVGEVTGDEDVYYTIEQLEQMGIPHAWPGDLEAEYQRWKRA